MILFYRYNLQTTQGPGWDTFAFLSNSSYFAGRDIGYKELERPPLISLLTSIPFRFSAKDSMSDNAIFAVDALVILLGTIGLYKLFRIRFPEIYSFLGALLFITFPVIIKWSTAGYTDVMSVALSIWVIYFLALSSNKNTIYCIPAFLIFLASILTRYTVLLIIAPIFILLLSHRKLLGGIKHFFIGVVAYIIASLPFAIFYSIRFDDPLFPFAAAFTQVEILGGKATSPFRDAIWYSKEIINNFINVNYIIIALVIAVLFVLGFISYLLKVLIKSNPKISKYLMFGFCLASYLLMFNFAGLVLRQLFILAISVSLYYLIKKDNDYAWLDIVFFAWFLSYFDYNSHIVFRLDRYLVQLAIPMAYVVILSFYSLTSLSSRKNVNKIISVIVFTILTIMIFTSGTLGFEKSPKARDSIVYDAKNAASWLKKNDKNLGKRVIYSDIWPVFGWYLQKKIKPMPTYKDDKSHEHELIKNNADYFLTIRERKFKNYKLYKKIRQIKILVKDGKPPYKPRILSIGQNWNRYIDEVLDYKYYVDNDIEYATGNYAFGRSLYIDGYNVKELRKYPLVALYNFKWKNRIDAEKTLIDYLNLGGNVIIDTSGNISTFYYNLNNSSFLNILNERKEINGRKDIYLNKNLGINNADIPFESKEAWSGIEYKPINSSVKIEVLANIGKDPLIIKQTIGKGNVYWIGYNFVWHSYLYENKRERKLIQKIFNQAYDSSRLLKK